MDILELTTLKKKSLRTVQALYDIGKYNEAERVFGCGTQIEIGKLADDTEKIIFANFCKFRFCPMCVKRQSLKRYHDMSTAWAQMQKQLAEDNIEWDAIMFTGTIKNCSGSDLRQFIDYLLKGWANITHNLKWWKKYCIATARSLEITYNRKQNTYHPHIHCLCVFRRDWFKSNFYKTVPDWRETWKVALRTAGYEQSETLQIEVHKIKERAGSRSDGALSEVTKYICKLPMVEDSDVLGVLIEQTKGVRFYSYTGLLKESMARLEKEKANDEASADDIFVAVMRFGWRGGCYVLRDDFSVRMIDVRG